MAQREELESLFCIVDLHTRPAYQITKAGVDEIHRQFSSTIEGRELIWASPSLKRDLRTRLYDLNYTYKALRLWPCDEVYSPNPFIRKENYHPVWKTDSFHPISLPKLKGVTYVMGSESDTPYVESIALTEWGKDPNYVWILGRGWCFEGEVILPYLWSIPRFKEEWLKLLVSQSLESSCRERPSKGNEPRRASEVQAQLIGNLEDFLKTGSGNEAIKSKSRQLLRYLNEELSRGIKPALKPEG